ncbi:MAG: hypothetical protein JWO22_361 [Frankiales bacterium]|nr:hypothetical protein [Frankiales bacterium]
MVTLCNQLHALCMPSHRVIARWTGFCAACPVEQPLLLVSSGPHGLRSWLAGAGPEDRTLSYACQVCGRVEHVPGTEAEDATYDVGLLRWPDWVEQVVEPVMVAAFTATDDFGQAALALVSRPAAPVAVVPAPRPASVRVVTLPAQRVSVTDLVAAAA